MKFLPLWFLICLNFLPGDDCQCVLSYLPAKTSINVSCTGLRSLDEFPESARTTYRYRVTVIEVTGLDDGSSIPNITTRNDLKMFPYLQELKLHSMGIERIECLSLANNRNLLKLDLTNNFITEGAIACLEVPILKQLILSSNSIGALTENLLLGSREGLQNLFLNMNQISECDPEFFQYTPNLIQLALHQNNIKSLKPNVFQNLKYLKDLNLAENQISVLPVGIFDSLNNLNQLDISYNALVDVDYNLLLPLRNLQELSIEGNLISSFNFKELVHYCRSLRHISLNYNLWNCTDVKDFEGIFKNNQVLIVSSRNENNMESVTCDIENRNFQGEVFQGSTVGGKWTKLAKDHLRKMSTQLLKPTIEAYIYVKTTTTILPPL